MGLSLKMAQKLQLIQNKITRVLTEIHPNKNIRQIIRPVFFLPGLIEGGGFECQALNSLSLQYLKYFSHRNLAKT